MFLMIFRRPYRFFLYAAVLAVIMCLLPIPAQDVLEEKEQLADLLERVEDNVRRHQLDEPGEGEF